MYEDPNTVFSEDPLENNRPNIEVMTTIMNLLCTTELDDVQRSKGSNVLKTTFQVEVSVEDPVKSSCPDNR